MIRSHSRFATRLIYATLVFFISLAISRGIISHDQQLTQRIAQQSFDNQARRIARNLQSGLDKVQRDLSAIAAFFNASHVVEADEFQTFTRPLLADSPEIQALEWIPKVFHAQRDHYQQQMHAYGYHAFQITEKAASGDMVTAAQHAIYYPVGFVNPLAPNLKAHGFDLNTSPARREALRYARDTGKPTTTAAITLVQETGDSKGFLVFYPVYDKRLPDMTALQRSEALQGFVLGVFRVDSLVSQAFRQTADLAQFQFTLSDTTSDRPTPLYSTHPAEGTTSTLNTFDQMLSLPNRQWQFHLLPTDDRMYRTATMNMINVWLIALITSGGLASLVYMLLLSRTQAKHEAALVQDLQRLTDGLDKKVEAGTKQLTQTNLALQETVNSLESQRQIALSLMEDAKIAQRRAEQHAQALEKSNQELDQFAYVASHDLKAPLNGIVQLVTWIEEDQNDPEEVAGHIRMLYSRAARMRKLLEDLLAYSRVGRKEGQLAAVSVSLLAEDVFQLISSSTGFVLHCDPDLPTFTTLITPLELVLRNLMNNAIKHHDKAVGQLHLSVQSQANFYRFCLADDGPGIAPDMQERAFGLFQTLQSRDKVEGSGMGLAIIKKTIEHHGGRIWVESDGQRGCRFYFTWPKHTGNAV